MATMITSECINCGACEPECPNTAIYQGGVEWELNGVTHPPISGEIFYIVPEKCTECVGFFDHEACAAVCPVDCCIPNPDIPETEAVLIARAKELHPGDEFPADFPSRFKGEGAPAAPAATDAASAPAPAAAPAAPAAAAAPPAAAAAAAPAPAAMPALAIPEVDDWEIPIECHRCSGTYGVAFRHFRAGVVFNCPYCNGTMVVTLPMHQNVAAAVIGFHESWRKVFIEFQERRQRELDEFEENQKRALEQFNASLTAVNDRAKPPGAPRKRAWIFG
jgi:ferredoxin